MSRDIALPDRLVCDGSFEHFVEVTHAIYERDFIVRPMRREGIPVHRDTRILSDGNGKEEAYWHLTQRKDKKSGVRVPDFDRASRLPWTRPIIESTPCDQIIAFDYDSGSFSQGGIKTYLWLKDLDFVVILKRKPKIFFLVTSFCITSDWLRADLQSKFDSRML